MESANDIGPSASVPLRHPAGEIPANQLAAREKAASVTGMWTVDLLTKGDLKATVDVMLKIIDDNKMREQFSRHQAAWKAKNPKSQGRIDMLHSFFESHHVPKRADQSLGKMKLTSKARKVADVATTVGIGQSSGVGNSCCNGSSIEEVSKNPAAASSPSPVSQPSEATKALFAGEFTAVQKKEEINKKERLEAQKKLDEVHKAYRSYSIVFYLLIKSPINFLNGSLDLKLNE